MELPGDNKNISRRTFLRAAGALLIVGLVRVLPSRESRPDLLPITPEVEPGDQRALYDPEIHMRVPEVETDGNEHCCADARDDKELEIHPENVVSIMRLEAPVFTMVHTVQDGDTVGELLDRYYGQTDKSETATTDGRPIAETAFLAAKPDFFKNPMDVFRKRVYRLAELLS
ncbi:hypothetical protein BH23PAT2_BH23PAT2_08390 [soil metagenome]